MAIYAGTMLKPVALIGNASIGIVPARTGLRHIIVAVDMPLQNGMALL